MAQSFPHRTPRLRGAAERDAILVALTLVVFTALLSLAIATQRVAALLGHASILGTPIALLPVVGTLYSPWSILVWAWQWRDVTAAKPILAAGMHIFEYPTLIVTGLAMVHVQLAKGTNAAPDDLHGSAHWANRREVRKTRLLNGDGVYVGAWQSGRRTHYLRDGGPSHVLAFAPTRSGKGVGLVIPTLLSWPESVVVHDIKGENWQLTAGWRKRALGSICLRFDPTCSDGTAARFNPLAEVRIGPEEVKDAQNIADMLIDPAGNAPRDHWDVTAHDLLTGLILHVIYAEPDKTLAGCLSFLNPPEHDQEKALREMIETRHSRDMTHAVVAGAAQSVLSKSPNERASVLSTATRCLTLFRDPIVAANTDESDFSVSDLMHHAQPVSLYLTVPPSDLTRTRPLIRLLLAQIGHRLTEHLQPQHDQRVGRRLLLMLDEFPALGRLDFLQTALSYAAGYGIKAYLIAQDLSQLYAAYGHDESILSNCGVRVAYAPNKIETARLISDMAGSATVRHEHRTHTGTRQTISEPTIQRSLLTPDEAMRLPEDAELILVSGSPPIYGAKIHYYLDPEFKSRSSMTAPKHSDRIARAPQWPPTPTPNTRANGHQNQSNNARSESGPTDLDGRDHTARNADREWLFK